MLEEKEPNAKTFQHSYFFYPIIYLNVRFEEPQNKEQEALAITVNTFFNCTAKLALGGGKIVTSVNTKTI